MAKIRKRLWLGDIYRYLVEGQIEHVQGIDCMYVNENHIRAILKIGKGLSQAFEFPAQTEEERRKAVKAINKHISEVHKNGAQ